MPAPRFKFTQANIAALPVAQFDYAVYDTELKGLKCRVRKSGSKTFEMERRPTGARRAVKVKICALGEKPLTGKNSVRVEGQAIIAQLGKGKDPNREKKVARAQAEATSLTLRKALADFIREKHTDSNPKANDYIIARTAQNYRRDFETHLADWLDLTFDDITSDMVVARHKEIAKQYYSAANNIIVSLRAVWGHTRAKYEDDEGVTAPFLSRACGK